MAPPDAPSAPEPDVRGRTVVWSAGSPATLHAWSRVRHAARRRLALVALGAAAVLVLGLAVHAWVLLTPAPAGPAAPLWLPEQPRVAAATTRPVRPTVRPQPTEPRSSASVEALRPRSVSRTTAALGRSGDDRPTHASDDRSGDGAGSGAGSGRSSGRGSSDGRSAQGSDDRGSGHDRSGGGHDGGSSGSGHGGSGGGSKGSGSKGSGSDDHGSKGSGSKGSGSKGSGSDDGSSKGSKGSKGSDG